ncbi:ArsR/SmtB family transcription factor [Xylocopilactobacillus apis]|uniref:HTH-type transcriptional regulator YceK n=1 Tax=Xylocopilactobacillus apis TaxID=2932183 RepID=A0AAU9DLC2_9LACO|nr:metalloregulator ArsR/SmtB family transcription factor [Xylocopilactobacillus apis]BDR55598.1 putative HTH-type transcriptional regulator YceK [Xylocopilactobacillus apis]
MDKEDEVRVKIFKALSDEMRLGIVRTLYLNEKEMACSEIRSGMTISDSTISYHLKILREADLAFTRKDAQNRLTTLKVETFNKYLPGFLETLSKE